ncbi:hypothetical protein ACFX1X_022337 [Malus domestica]
MTRCRFKFHSGTHVSLRTCSCMSFLRLQQPKVHRSLRNTISLAASVCCAVLPEILKNQSLGTYLKFLAPNFSNLINFWVKLNLIS